MPFVPHPITVLVYDTDGSTAKANVNVYVRNCTKKSTSDKVKTNASGYAMIDLANLSLTSGQTAPYNTSDVILIIASYGNTSDGARYVVTGNSKDQTLYLNNSPLRDDNAVRLLEITTGNTSATVAYCKIWAFADGELLYHIETPANDTRTVVCGGGYGKLTGGGFIIERESKDLIVTTAIK
jgi:hypothetical protein